MSKKITLGALTFVADNDPAVHSVDIRGVGDVLITRGHMTDAEWQSLCRVAEVVEAAKAWRAWQLIPAPASDAERHANDGRLMLALDALTAVERAEKDT